ncbi:MAG: hypothetical protein E7588_00300 [Ruminococcaceae bacterium]|nr:hypothetical protein [Oscillospiraceae bacterium]
MAHKLPEIVNSGIIPIDHFPTRMQCFIFRNWEIISPKVIGEVLGCDEKTVLALAEEMGLAVPPKVEKEWLTKGYITIIRANWHLCSHEQLAYMLGWTTEKLAYILREDDFLYVKIGYTKPQLPELRYEPLTEQQKKQTAHIRTIVENARRNIPHDAAKPFDFIPRFIEAAEQAGEPAKIKNAQFNDRIVYSYCALYGDTFADKELLDASFPDELLMAYKALGINGVWTQAVLYTLTPYPFDEKMSEGYETRLKYMRYLVDKLKKYDIKLFLYLNEPRAMPLSFFEKYPDLKGHVNEETGYASLCVSTKPVQEYLYNASRFLCSNVPGLGGIFTITASENQTNCYSHGYDSGCNCPRCSKRSPSEVIADTNRFLYEGAKSVDPDFTFIAWNWAWHKYSEQECFDTIEKLPEGIIPMSVSEERVEKTVGGVDVFVRDYSISVEGPGRYARAVWDKAHTTGHKAYAKLQLGDTWEMATAMCIPAFEKIYRHLCRLTAECSIDGALLGWTLGGFPSPALKLAQGFFEKSDTPPTLDELYTKMFPGADIPALSEAFHVLSEAFDEFPFHVDVIYNAPQLYGSSNLLYTEKTGYPATMVGYPYDDLDKWRSVYPRDVFISQFKKLSDGWHEGTLLLEKAAEGTNDKVLISLVRCTKVIDCHYRSVYNQSVFVDKRDCGEIDIGIAKDEMRLAAEMLVHMSEDPTVGYESSNHYFFTKNTLLEKILNCDYIINKYE